MLRYLLVCGLLAGLSFGARFDDWRTEHGVTYPTHEEHVFREQVFKSNLALIAELNADPDDMAEYGTNKFSDRTPAELQLTHKMPRRHAIVGRWAAQWRRQDRNAGATHCEDAGNCQWKQECYACKRFPAFGSNVLPKSINWTALGAVTPVKDQGNCGDCFTFGATGDVEGTWFLAGHNLTALSEQQITSCDSYGEDSGCGGGATDLDTFEYIIQNGGIASEADYPFCSGKNHKCPVPSGASHRQQKNGICDKAKEKAIVAKIGGYFQISGGVKNYDPQPINETRVMEALVRVGPVTIGVDSKLFDNYKRGIMSPKSGKKCGSGMNALDHQVLLTGYGEDQQGNLYWIVKNSWNADWGEDGYVRILRGGQRNPTMNTCGVIADVSHSRPIGENVTSTRNSLA
jgi:hypothetical protein